MLHGASGAGHGAARKHGSHASYYQYHKFAGFDVLDSLGSSVAVALLRGKKKCMEDYVVVQRHEPRRLTVYAVVDGHLGTSAAEYVRARLADTFVRRLEAFDSIETTGDEGRDAVERVVMRQLFLELHAGFVSSSQQHDGGSDHDFSGCTLSVVVHFEDEDRLLSETSATHERFSSQAIPTTHFLKTTGRTLRKSGSASNRAAASSASKASGESWDNSRSREASAIAIFVIIASDDVWDTMENDDVFHFVRDKQQHSKTLPNVAADLVQEAFLRGSLDNLAVLIVNLHDTHKTQ